MNIRPIWERIVCEALPQKETISPGGIVLLMPDDYEAARIISAGAGKISDALGKAIPMVTKVGDVVAIHKTAGVRVRIEGRHLIVIREFDILFVLDNYDEGKDEKPIE
jgi:chaperonin GroES